IVATVLTRKGERLGLDFGAKRSGGDWGSPELVGAEADHLYTAEEHAGLRIHGGSGVRGGGRVAVLPPHSRTTVNLSGRACGGRAGRLEEIRGLDGRAPLASG